MFIGCCVSHHQITRAVSERAFLAMALKAWLIGTQNRKRKHTEIQPTWLARAADPNEEGLQLQVKLTVGLLSRTLVSCVTGVAKNQTYHFIQKYVQNVQKDV